MRGQSAVLGLVLLIGIVVISSVGILLVAGDTADEMERQSEIERVEQSFLELSHELQTASTSSDVSRSMEMAIGEDSDQVEMRNEGRVIVTVDGTTVVNRTMGTIVYEADDGRVVAYQGGAVWRGTGNETQLLSAPEIHYRDGMLMLPVQSIQGNDTIGSEGLAMRKNDSDVRFNDAVQHGNVSVVITSEYHAGWSAYYEGLVGEDAVDHSPADERVTITFNGGRDVTFDSALETSSTVTVSGTLEGDVVTNETIVPSNYCDGNPDCSVEENAAYDHEPLDDEIDEMIADGPPRADWDGTIDDDTTYNGGTHYVDGIDLAGGDDLTLDVSTGDITLVVDGDITFGGNAELQVINTDSGNVARIYTTGSIEQSSGTPRVCVETCGDGSDTSALQLYGTSNTAIHMSGAMEYEGVIYAPTENASSDVALSGTVDFYGAVVGGPTSISSSSSFIYDEDLQDFEAAPIASGDSDESEIDRLNVVVHDVEVTDE